MKAIKKEEILDWDEKYRLKFINSISGYKGAHLIGTQDLEGQTGLAIFNSVVHISSEPPRVGFVMRPLTVERHTYDNIVSTGHFTINHVHKSFAKKAHYTSVKAEKGASEFDLCQLTPETIEDFNAPFVGESKIKFGLQLVEEVEIKANGSVLMIGEIRHVLIDENVISGDGQLDLEAAHDICVTGLNQYSSVKKFKTFPYARLAEFPNFKQKERPDLVAFDEESQSYNSSRLPYGTNIGAPRIQPTGISVWKNTSIHSFNHSFNNKIERLKDNYESLIEEYRINERLYNAQMNFEPIIGQVYHLYTRDRNEDCFLSLIPPESWKKEHLGSFKLNHEKIWEPFQY